MADNYEVDDYEVDSELEALKVKENDKRQRGQATIKNRGGGAQRRKGG